MIQADNNNVQTLPATTTTQENAAPHLGVAVVLPCYKSRDHVAAVIETLPDLVGIIICVDDACPDKTTMVVKDRFQHDKRVHVLEHEHNQGVGGAVLTGWEYAAANGADILIKMDSDGQMDPAMIEELIAPLLAGKADYAKGNRFYSRSSFAGMPPFRIFGNGLLSFASKAASGYWTTLDPLNGFVALRADVFRHLDTARIARRFRFESDLLAQLYLEEVVVADVNMPARYGSETSNFQASRQLLPFVSGYMRNALRRILYTYFVRDFNAGSLQLVFAIVFGLLALLTGVPPWILSAATGEASASGTVIMPAVFAIFSLQSFLGFLNEDVSRGANLRKNWRRR
ncbi:MAG: glycosyltransferase family 2 protein [Parvularcula sp.]|jgi:glycosyltransferase involved in cell wall biosynthesis|nr:glycosyltransferase family 2 protein [Parvularcula sp.]